MIVLSGGDVVLPDRIIAGGSVVIDGSRIVAVEADHRGPSGGERVDVRGCYVVPGFIDVHVHGIGGYDTLDDGDVLMRIAAALPRFGVTAFCPTTVACAPDALRRVLTQVRTGRTAHVKGSARVLPAHLESNFINPAFCGAQPVSCLRLPSGGHEGRDEGSFSGSDILDVMASARAEVGIVTLAPELDGSVDLVRSLVSAGHRVSLGHSGADFETAIAAIDAGARHATHLFNRMSPLSHRAPGLVGAALSRREVAAELICDGVHVHDAVVRLAIAAKGVERMIAITDGTAGSGLPEGSTARLGGRTIHVRDRAAYLDDGTLAGSTLTMDGALRRLVSQAGCSLREAVMMCSTTPARELELRGFGTLSEGAFADVVVLDRELRVQRTFIDGREAFSAQPGAGQTQ
ncbi:MAG TPA: N-acetylglucosamine-6-phosphate deacetylase [Vicinamibacterales bacterium]|nr:N-acetylglucosamine-6-phosphate deacetylase [Vicinamibacterales bacterium]